MKSGCQNLGDEYAQMYTTVVLEAADLMLKRLGT